MAEESPKTMQETQEPKSDEIDTSINSDQKCAQNDSESRIKTPIKVAANFSVNPFKEYQNYEDSEEDDSKNKEKEENNEKEEENNEKAEGNKEKEEENMNIKSVFSQKNVKEMRVPHLFQTRPLKDAMEQVNKFSELQKDLKSRIHEKQLELVSDELRTLRSKPEISKHSKEIMQKKDYVPLYKRTEEILSKKEAKLVLERKKKEEIKEAIEKSITFKPELIKKQETLRAFDKFEESMKNWTRTKQEKIAKKQFLNLEKEVQAHPFRPEINQKSKKLLEKKGYSQERKVENRLLESREKEKKRKMQEIEKNKPLFKPQLTAKTDRIASERKYKKNYLVEFLQSPEKIEKLNIQITSQGVEVFVKEKEPSTEIIE